MPEKKGWLRPPFFGLHKFVDHVLGCEPTGLHGTFHVPPIVATERFSNEPEVANESDLPLFLISFKVQVVHRCRVLAAVEATVTAPITRFLSPVDGPSCSIARTGQPGEQWRCLRGEGVGHGFCSIWIGRCCRRPAQQKGQ